MPAVNRVRDARVAAVPASVSAPRRAQRRRILPPVLAALVLGLSACAPAEPELPRLTAMRIDPARVSVSGLSSGAYMAQQLHLAYSDRLLGAALFAGGPYGCAQGELSIALERCMAPTEGAGPDLAALAASVRERAAAGQLAPLDGLAGDRVYVWRGQRDALVGESITRGSAELYASLAGSVQLNTDFARPIAHLLPTVGSGGQCETAAPPYIAACGFDLAGEAIRWLHPETPEQAPAQATGSLSRVDVRPADGSDPPGGDSAFLYVPRACAAGETCGLHIALHGCEQPEEKIGDAFAAGAGFNRWADAAKLLVLYPQARTSMLPLNPKGCWDWWGYSGADYDTRDGAQLRWIAGMAAALGAPLDPRDARAR
jgi:poly(3-hydroxybutyrate) depolymerase